MPSDALFEIDEVTLRRGDTTILDRVSATIPANGCTVLMGPSGSGKSSLLRLLVRLEEPSSGEVRLEGRPLPSIDVLDLRRRVQLVPQQPTLVTEMIADEVRVGRPGLTRSEVAVLLDRVGLPDEMIERRTAGLSGGEAQRLCLARALALEPDTLLLDEPTSALDEESERAIESLIREHIGSGGTAVLVSHGSEQIRRLADHLITIDQGRIVEPGPPTHWPEQEVPQ